MYQSYVREVENFQSTHPARGCDGKCLLQG